MQFTLGTMEDPYMAILTCKWKKTPPLHGHYYNVELIEALWETIAPKLWQNGKYLEGTADMQR